MQEKEVQDHIIVIQVKQKVIILLILILIIDVDEWDKIRWINK